jgi:succinate-semialdehyde dehydrogenase / glutarate-semialdehyde dehydrogenase
MPGTRGGTVRPYRRLPSSAWNFPVQLPARKLAAALAAGCSVILKPAEETPASPMLMVHCFLDAGLPREAINLVYGHPAEVSERLIASEHVRKVSLTGSVAVGKLLGQMCAARVKRFSGELGGHAPVIVCEDADPAPALRAALTAKYRNAGQVCASPIRFYVHQRHWSQWSEGFVAGAQSLRLGSGLDTSTQMGPLTHARRLDDMQRFVDDARSRGARIACGGGRVARPGYFFEPTVITDAHADCLVQQLEPFGPMAVMQPFEDLSQAIEQANALPYGLAAYAFTRDVDTLHQLGEQLEAGMVGINHFGVSQPEMPFGGWKESGIGQEMGAEGLLHYTEIKTLLVASAR